MPSSHKTTKITKIVQNMLVRYPLYFVYVRSGSPRTQWADGLAYQPRRYARTTIVVGIGRGICSVVHTSDYLLVGQFPIMRLRRQVD
jgi:hypothetical protein